MARISQARSFPRCRGGLNALSGMWTCIITVKIRMVGSLSNAWPPACMGCVIRWLHLRLAMCRSIIKGTELAMEAGELMDLLAILLLLVTVACLFSFICVWFAIFSSFRCGFNLGFYVLSNLYEQWKRLTG